MRARCDYGDVVTGPPDGRTVDGMTPGGYIGSGIGCGVAGVVVVALAQADNDVEAAMRAAEYATGGTPSGSGDGFAYLIALALFAAAVVLILIGAIGAGVRAGRPSDAQHESH